MAETRWEGGATRGGEKDHPTSQIDLLGVVECRRVVKNTQRVVGLVGCCVTWLGRGGARGVWLRRGGRVEGRGEGVELPGDRKSVV